ncbi:MAG TPA: hypothetical protein VKX46_02465 [Ktedonobacteraceae bacterium]|nr:hypothetical protein [Ktedonobacteraceae bacterium]
MIDRATTAAPFNRDTIRQALNVICILAVIFVTVLGYVIGLNKSFTATNTGTPPIVPIDYAFIVWAVIYGGALIYSIYQALPGQREDPLQRRIGFFTASAYLATALWILFAQLGWNWLTVVCFVWILASLLGAFIPLIAVDATLSWTQRLIIVFPLSVFLGWTTIALIANTGTALYDSGFSNVLLSDANWTILMMLVGATIVLFVVLQSKGNIGYSLTVSWALFGIMVANIVRTPNPSVAIVAGSLGVIVVLCMIYAWFTTNSWRHVLKS